MPFGCRRSVRPKFCHALTAPELESECITEPGPGGQWCASSFQLTPGRGWICTLSAPRGSLNPVGSRSTYVSLPLLGARVQDGPATPYPSQQNLNPPPPPSSPHRFSKLTQNFGPTRTQDSPPGEFAQEGTFSRWPWSGPLPGLLSGGTKFPVPCVQSCELAVSHPNPHPHPTLLRLPQTPAPTHLLHTRGAAGSPARAGGARPPAWAAAAPSPRCGRGQASGRCIPLAAYR